MTPHGGLGLTSPWCRQALPDYAERRAFMERIPEHYSVGVSALSNHSAWRTWVVDTSGPKNIVLIGPHDWPPMRDIRAAIDRAIAWIEEYDSAEYAGVQVPVR